ncbi:MAG TPA: hypothetical protein VLJ16_13535 [Acidobacteriota bacterium]|nr:hypothetical protein [Acidobacteriota bacterium]
MKVFRTILGILLVLIGGVWVLQGINILPGSFMTGQIKWAAYGGIAVVIGIIVISWAQKKKRIM